jgi:ABC-type methionine transport system ATPase subunit
MAYKESIEHLMTFLKTSKIDTKSTQEAIKLLLDITQADISTVAVIQKELVERVCSKGSPTLKDNALNALCAISKKHPTVLNYHKFISESTLCDLMIERVRLLE